MNVVTNLVACLCKGKLCQVTLKHKYLTLHPLGMYPKDEENVFKKIQQQKTDCFSTIIMLVVSNYVNALN